MANPHRHLLIVDPQNDFCDLPESWLIADPDALGAADASLLQPRLPVAGAHADMLRLAEFIDATRAAWSAVTTTLDSHHRVGIERPTFWWGRGEDGQLGDVAPFTTITAADVRAGRYTPRLPGNEARERVLRYLDALEARGRYKLMVWPVHCQIGTWGHNVHAAVRMACDRWEEQTQSVVEFLFKGSNPWTEHYSPFQAEVPDPDDASSQLDRQRLEVFEQADVLYVAGQASSHCVRAAVLDLVQTLGAPFTQRLVLLADCMSPVTGFEAPAAAFLDAMRSRGARVVSAQEAAQELRRAS